MILVPKDPLSLLEHKVEVAVTLSAALLHSRGDIIWYPHWYQRVWDYVTADPHLSMLSLFALSFFVDVLEPKTCLGIKRRTSHFLLSTAFFTLTLAILFHGFSPKCAYSGRVRPPFK